MPKFKVTYRVTEYQRVSGKQVEDAIEADNIHQARLKARHNLPLDVHTADIVKMVTELRVTEETSEDKESEPQTDNLQDGEMLPCCLEALERENHYHCGKCGGVTGFYYGHYNPSKDRFECPAPRK